MQTGAAEEPVEAAALRAEQDERLRIALEAQREAFDRELMRRAFRIAELEEELEKARREYEASLSWRITQPLRSAKALLRKRR